MNLFVVGDVHGCYYTWQQLLRHWQPAKELLIQVGDLVDRGNFTPATVASAISLRQRHPDSVFFLKGNHEASLWQHCGPDGPYPPWLQWGGRGTLFQYQLLSPATLRHHAAWLNQLPLYWENDHLFISHAGLADTPQPLSEANPDGILWRRGPLRNLGRRQVVGHTPTPDGTPVFDEAANAFYLDTGAYTGRGLTAIRLSPTGDLLDTITIPTHADDIA
ncbi:metallophosphoesterase [Hymenobacter aerilatus]|uniref:Metallophosphoesterase n=1 Tax=Hymenobacter aerilatus TaxID=2932251 RepID=A0A8T9T232_9BACT|nr:metallophosphoesterase [Hymenobacter aerilatus]UOR06156.1 metallophosphoesterase [Hymenobacter aerilatus]